MIMEAEKSQDLQSAIQRLKRVNAVTSSPKAGSLETQRQERLMSQLSSQAGGVPSYWRKNHPFCTIQAFNRLDEGPP